MTAFLTFADAEALVSEELRDANIPDLARRVYSSVPASPTYPLVTVQRLGGIPPERRYLDAAYLQVEAWGNSKSQAHDIAADARVILLELEDRQLPEAVCTAARDALGLTWMPDPETHRDRYVFAVRLYLRPTYAPGS